MKGNSLHSAAEAGDVTEIESLLALGFSIDRRDGAGATPLMVAADNGKLQAVKCLLKQGADPSLQDNSGWNLLHFASEGGNPEVIELMLNHVSSIDSINKTGITPLMIAAFTDKLQAVKSLLKQGADPSLQENRGWNVLHFASEGGNPEVIELMLSHVPTIDSRTKEGSTPLMIAAVNDKLQAVKYLLKQGADRSLQHNDGWNVLHFASEGGNPEVIELMLSHVPSIDSRTKEGSTPLMIAAYNDKLQAVKCLLKQGADPSLQDNRGWNLLHFASQGGNPEVIELMLSHVPSIDSRTKEGSTPLMIAAVNDKLQAVKCLLKQGADPSLQDNRGWNLLHFASQGGNPEVIELMLSHVPSIDSRTKAGIRPLMIAAFTDKLQAVKCLLKQGADPSLQDNRGWNVLHSASQGGNPEVIQLMLSHVPSIDSRTKAGITPLMIAAFTDNLQAVQCLLKQVADRSLQDNRGWNLLHFASQGGNPEVIELMLSHVPSIDLRTKEGSTPLMIAAFTDKLQAVKYLLKQGADPSLQDNRGWNLLHFASQGGNPEVIELMLSHVPSIDLRTKAGITPLMIAAFTDKLQVVQCLLKQGADRSLQDNRGWNLLHFASEGGNPEVIELMLSHVPSIDSRTKEGYTPLMRAAVNDKLQAVKYLLKQGADPSLQNNRGWNVLDYASQGGNLEVIELILRRA